MWWIKHVWVIVMQLVAFIPYLIGSYKFYKGKRHFMPFIITGIAMDVVIAIVASSGKLPRMESSQGAPWGSPLFIAHIVLAGVAMLGFLCLFMYLLINGTHRPYLRLRRFQYKVLMRMWIAGVIIALVNFFTKVCIHIRIYDFF